MSIGEDANEFESERGQSFEDVVRINLTKLYTEVIESIDYQDFL